MLSMREIPDPSRTGPKDAADATRAGRETHHDYVRHGTTTLFAALEIATARSRLMQAAARHKSSWFSAPPRRGTRPTAALIMDNYAAHKHRRSKPGWRRTRAFTSTSPRPQVVAQPRRGLVRDHRTPSHPPRHLRLRPRPHDQDPGLRRRLDDTDNPSCDQDRRPDPQESRP